jgi:peptidyl-prolyl cis-trans isomerase SDCCAG10
VRVQVNESSITGANQKFVVIENLDATAVPMPESLLGPPKKSKEQPRERTLEKESVKVRHSQRLPSDAYEIVISVTNLQKVTNPRAWIKTSRKSARHTRKRRLLEGVKSLIPCCARVDT